MIKFILGLLIVFGAVGGMDDPSQADHFLEQVLLTIVGLIMMSWGAHDLQTPPSQKRVEITEPLGLK